MKRLRKLEQAVIAALLCCPLAVASAQEVPLIGGVYRANGNIEYTLTPSLIDSLEATNGATVQTAGNLKVRGKENYYSLHANKNSQIIVNGNLDANFGKGNSGGFSGIITFTGAKIVLNGKENTITSDSTNDRNTKSAFQALGTGSEIIVNSDKTTITYTPGGFWFDSYGANRGIAAGDGGKIVFSNGKQGAESSLVEIKGNANSKRNIMSTLNSSSVSNANANALAHKYAGDTQFLPSVETVIYLDRVDIYNKNSYTRGIFTQGHGAQVSLLEANINKDTNYGASALEATVGSKIEVRGYDQGALNIGLGGGFESGLRAQGATVSVNTSQASGFKTEINAKGKGEIGIASGTIGATVDNTVGGRDIVDGKGSGQYGSKYADSEITVNGTVKITVDSEQSIGLRAMGDGSKIFLKALADQERSSINTKSTAVRFAFANGYNLAQGVENDGKQKIVTGGQIITIENADVSGAGSEYTQANAAYISGNLVQAGSHGVVTKNDGLVTGVMQVQDAVKNATLNLKESSLKLNDPQIEKDIINVTYGEMTSGDIAGAGGNTIAEEGKVASQLTVNANKSALEGSVFTDYTLDKEGNPSELHLNLEQSTWNISKDAVEENDWQGEKVKGNFVTNLNNKESEIRIDHTDGKFHDLYVADTYTGENGVLRFNTVFDDDDSQTDRLIAKNTAGSTDVYFENIGGMGAKTNTGIEVIKVLDKSDGVFNQKQRLVFGAYDYKLKKGGNAGNEKTGIWFRRPRLFGRRSAAMLKIELPLSECSICASMTA